MGKKKGKKTPTRVEVETFEVRSAWRNQLYLRSFWEVYSESLNALQGCVEQSIELLNCKQCLLEICECTIEYEKFMSKMDTDLNILISIYQIDLNKLPELDQERETYVLTDEDRQFLKKSHEYSCNKIYELCIISIDLDYETRKKLRSSLQYLSYWNDLLYDWTCVYYDIAYV